MGLSHVVDVDQLLDVGNIQAWVELSEVVISDGRVFLLRTALVPYQRTFADLAAFEKCKEECLGLFKLVGDSMLASQGLCGEMYSSFSSLLPREFLTESMEDLVAPS